MFSYLHIVQVGIVHEVFFLGRAAPLGCLASVVHTAALAALESVQLVGDFPVARRVHCTHHVLGLALPLLLSEHQRAATPAPGVVVRLPSEPHEAALLLREVLIVVGFLRKHSVLSC
jgi:hypothetical protein